MSLSSLRKKVGNFIAGEDTASSSTSTSGSYSDKNHTPLPVDPYLYQGLRYEYCFNTINVLTVGESSRGLTGTKTVVSSDITSKYSELSSPYSQGFLLVDFNNVPGIGKIGWNSSESPFQAIFSKPLGMQVQHSWQLLVVKSSIHTSEQSGIMDQMSGRSHEVANKSGILAAIAQQAGRGGRIVCIEHTGQKRTSGMTKNLLGGSDEIGCDLFFNMPLHQKPILYTYQLINVPVKVMMFGPGQLVKVSCEWMKHFSMYLQQGWRLAEIFWDQGKRSHGDFTFSGDHNSVWFFEKEKSRLNDPTPVYHGTIIEYKHTVKIGFFQTKAKGDWAPMISEMGSRGWELACMLETPEVTNVGLGTITYKVLFFFQRKIIVNQGQPYQPPPSGAPQGHYPSGAPQGNYPSGAQQGLYPSVAPQGHYPSGAAQGHYTQYPPYGAPLAQGPPPPYSANDRPQPSAPFLPEKH